MGRRSSHYRISARRVEKAFATANLWLLHRRKVHQQQLTNWCDDCGARYGPGSNIELANHCFTKHSGETPFACKWCGRQYALESGMKKKHVWQNHCHKTHECDECGRRFKNRWYLTAHFDSHVREKRHLCTVCGKRYFFRTGRWRCEMLHSKGERPYECENCGKRFRSSCNREQHMRIHKGSLPFCCLTCRRLFRSIGNLINHEKTHCGK